MLMLVVSELGEAIEAHRTGLAGLEAKDTFEDEIADTVIRIFDMCEGFGIDLERHIELKLEYNRTRPYKHGKKY